MAQLRNRTTGLVRDSRTVEREIRSRIACGKTINFADFGEDVVFAAPAPAYDPITHAVRELQPTLNALGQYAQAWEVVALDAETVAANQAAEVAKFAKAKTDAIAKTYADVDAIYDLTIGNRAEEYKQAEADARAFKAAGYAGTPSAYVSGWATAKGLTNTQSADAIIARADALTAAKLSLRNQRFTSQAAISAATTTAEIDAAVATWDAYVAATKAALA